MTSKEIRIMSLENRVNKLKSKPVENAALIKKAQRQLRKLQAESNRKIKKFYLWLKYTTVIWRGTQVA